MDSGETFYALVEKDYFNEKPIRKEQKVTIAGTAFGNNKNNIDVDTDALYALDYALY